MNATKDSNFNDLNEDKNWLDFYHYPYILAREQNTAYLLFDEQSRLIRRFLGPNKRLKNVFFYAEKAFLPP